jgi:hypothetical protein
MNVETTVPDDDATVHECPYCSRPFATSARVDLHVGLEHYDVCSDPEVDAFETAYAAETEELRLYRLKAAAATVLLYFGMLMVYAVAT